MTTTLADPDATFARRLREVRKQSGMTQQQLAGRMKMVGHRMGRSTIAKIELGERLVTLGEAVQLADLLGTPLMDLVTDAAGSSPQRKAWLDAQIAVCALQLQAAEQHKRLDEAQVLYDATARRLAAAQELAAGQGPA